MRGECGKGSHPICPLGPQRPAKPHESRVQQWPIPSTNPFVFRSAVIATIVLSTLVERALSIREWSSLGLRSCFVSVCEAEDRFLFAVVPYPCCGAIRLLKHQA